MPSKSVVATEPISSDFKIMNQAIVDISPLALATVPWGVLCGSLAITVGLTPLQAQLMSLLIFAGAAQLAALTIMGSVGSISSMFSSTFVISSRHLLYSAVFREHVRKSSLGLRCSIAFFLTDEMFAVTCAYMEKHKNFSAVYALSSGITFYVIWNISTFAGIIAGQHIPNLEHLGLEFAIAATFIAIVIPNIKNRSTLVSVVSSGLSAIILSIFMEEYALIIATFIGMFCGYLTKDNDKNKDIINE
ncbi:AzlC family ABC transporter permease [Colwellia sp. 12G3]|uniref:AzlC family ABC transporter permease n=1 Tax=Colwellia sp. 12G3 TaxID=2058299 RepID=UPI000C33D8A4|nr:AzlC family ABC transporter permease [Colwellia sp. 12G3]PKI16243.1 branched-chain amino acid ABC transporter permease [Colwellia sp. 12G3]